MQNNNVFWVIGGIVILAGVVGFVMATSNNNDNDVMMEESPSMMEEEKSSMMEETGTEEDAMMEEDELMMEKDVMEGEGMMEDEMMMQSGSYEKYNESKLAMAEKGDVVLFFRASWCPTCRALDSDIKENMGSIPADLTILDVDYDSMGDLKKKYGVTTQHTLVQVDAQGNEIAKWVGSNSLEKLVSEVQ